MGNQYGKTSESPRRCRQVRFTDAEWAELGAGAAALGETRSEAIRAGSLCRVRQAIPDAREVTPRTVALFVCGWCGAEFMTETDAHAHLAAQHQESHDQYLRAAQQGAK